MSDRADPEIIFERRGRVGLITLNRPKALNALTLSMIRAMHAQLQAWANDEAVTRVVVRGAGGRAFCAGGDIRQIYELGKAGRSADTLAFWLAEYQLDAYVKRYPKPYIALIEGVVMGGGVGISLHGDVRVASEKYMFAMPETGIGYFPDVGMSYALPRLPGRTGTYLAVTGARVGAGDALALGLATHAAKAAEFDAIVEALAQGDDIEATLAAHTPDPPETGPLVAERSLIDECFSAPSVHDILGRLDVAASSGASFPAETASLIRSRSPTSVLIAFEQMRRGVDLSFAEAMLTEYRLCTRVMHGHDFYEGVRSVIVDKDGKPDWRPATLDAVDPATIAAAFEPLSGSEPSFA
ncbi:enoyl-CoA hydratase/isomerase family protein [Methylobacterium haplocladii]|uniref:3-hydroxyisobutyryl-CoA hydrolase n=1 Tax=Methylobacterium haplocladii TaxID=1176176 RepID=A0A512IJS9_9HYPH|nr:enoyl-CoA hydratase/isomerase family protein [Methylobacterium haplocladii]GEO97949.1 enoyl-CoA hydratase [Methylobacterium haplocladii]GJD85996.1 1,4-dihydroxy-2-naphthoyl-CoA synthase [Methylobacterium haplocladii]GLS58716.1 enoyl-CoA hydratase [Methylobacterium haplocladii]